MDILGLEIRGSFQSRANFLSCEHHSSLGQLFLFLSPTTLVQGLGSYHELGNHQGDLQYVVSLATQSLKSGNIIAVPTDTIYGVAGLAQRNDATSRIYQLKNRDLKKPIAISVADIDDVYKWGHVTVSRELLSELLPGPVTVVFTRKEELSPSLNPNVSLIGIRIPDQLFIRSLARSCQEPIALTSANISAAPSTVSVE
ncbi:threonylcarbamoyl-AMP synthase-like, partial [Argopecten irradians]|uniref:threonylcarbamoyl-AMP synthase-like n=1 Tax=Argopecten irradians TaxID=31199 RepID=UPI00371033A1